MKITFREVVEKARKAADARLQLQTEDERVNTERNRLKAEAETAIDAGDAEKYLSLKQQMERLDVDALIRKRQLEKTSVPATREECVAAWADYRPAYEKNLTTSLAALDKARVAYLKAYNDCVDLQEEACKTREELASFCDVKTDALSGNEIDLVFPMKTIPNITGINEVTLKGPTGVLDKDLAFVVAYTGKEPVTFRDDPDVLRLLAVVARKRSK